MTSAQKNSTIATSYDAKGDLLAGTGADAFAKLTVGSNNTVLMADSTTGNGLKYAAEATATLTAKGDLLSATAANTLSRLAVGSNDQVLTADSTTATGLKWATPSSGAMTSLFSGSLSGSAIDMNNISSGYKDLVLVVRDYYASLSFGLNVAINGTTITTMSTLYWGSQSPGGTVIGLTSGTGFSFNNAANTLANDAQNMAVAIFYDYTNTNSSKIISSYCQYKNASTSNLTMEQHLRTWQTTSAISRLYMTTDAGTFSGGSYILYGVK